MDSTMLLQVNGTTAQFPAMGFVRAIERLQAGVSEPLFGRIAMAHCQITPNALGQLDAAWCERLTERWPQTRFRTHANARIQERHRFVDLSVDFDDLDNRRYIADLADRNRRLGAPAVSLHSGYASQCSFEQMLVNRARVEEAMGIPVMIEGMYPSNRHAYLVATWAEYAEILRREVPLAVDLSHLNIVQAAEGPTSDDLVRELCEWAMEIHVSDNDGTADQHAIPRTAPWWIEILQSARLRPDCVIFTEGRRADTAIQWRREGAVRLESRRAEG